MDLEFLTEEKSFVTYGALEWLLTAVYKPVLTQSALVSKCASADVTGIRSFPGVQANVAQQVVPGRELLAAGLTLERRIIGVTVAVHFQLGCPVK